MHILNPSKIASKQNNNSTIYGKNYQSYTGYSHNFDSKNFSLNINSDFIPEKFKNLQLKNQGAFQEEHIVIDEPAQIEEVKVTIEESKNPSSKKKEIESSLDFLQQQRQVKKPENGVSSKSIRKGDEQKNSDEVISSIVIHNII
jgi:hypothetical protein